MSAEFFLDTNILVYTFDEEAGEKRRRANDLVEEALRDGRGVISFQVVQEFLNVSQRRFRVPLSSQQASRYLEEVLQPLCEVLGSIELYRHALLIQERWRFGFYDSLIVAAALEAEVEILYTEDLQNGQLIETLRIVDPFT